MAVYDVIVLFQGQETELTYSDVDSITYVNGESHGPGPIAANTINVGQRRLILHADRVDAAVIERKS